MTNYQKAIKVRKICENTPICKGNNKCPYLDECRKSKFICYPPIYYHIETVAKAIKEEKWNVK